MVQAAAREVHAKVIKSEEFSKMLRQPDAPARSASEISLTEEEVAEWEEIFRHRNADNQ